MTWKVAHSVSLLFDFELNLVKAASDRELRSILFIELRYIVCIGVTGL